MEVAGIPKRSFRRGGDQGRLTNFSWAFLAHFGLSFKALMTNLPSGSRGSFRGGGVVKGGLGKETAQNSRNDGGIKTYVCVLPSHR